TDLLTHTVITSSSMLCTVIRSCVSITHTFTYFFLFNHPTPTEIYTLSLHDALPISQILSGPAISPAWGAQCNSALRARSNQGARSEEHTSELQSLAYLVCRLLLEKKK